MTALELLRRCFPEDTFEYLSETYRFEYKEHPNQSITGALFLGDKKIGIFWISPNGQAAKSPRPMGYFLEDEVFEWSLDKGKPPKNDSETMNRYYLTNPPKWDKI